MIHLPKILTPLLKQRRQLYKGTHYLNVLVLGSLLAYDLTNTHQQHQVVDDQKTSIIEQLIREDINPYALKNLETSIVQILPNTHSHTDNIINYFAITNTPKPLSLEDVRITAPLYSSAPSFHFPQVTPGHTPPPSSSTPMTALIEQKESHQAIGDVAYGIVQTFLDPHTTSPGNNGTPPKEGVLNATLDEAQENIMMFNQVIPPLPPLLLDLIGAPQHPIGEGLPPPDKTKATVDQLSKFKPYQENEIFDVRRRYMNYACDQAVCEGFFGFSEKDLNLIRRVVLKFNHFDDNDQRALKDFQSDYFLDSLKRMPNLERLEIQYPDPFDPKDLKDLLQVLKERERLEFLEIGNGGALPPIQLNIREGIEFFAQEILQPMVDAQNAAAANLGIAPPAPPPPPNGAILGIAPPAPPPPPNGAIVLPAPFLPGPAAAPAPQPMPGIPVALPLGVLQNGLQNEEKRIRRQIKEECRKEMQQLNAQILLWNELQKKRNLFEIEMLKKHQQFIEQIQFLRTEEISRQQIINAYQSTLVLSPMPGVIVDHLQSNSPITVDQEVCTMETMKMQIKLKAEKKGTFYTHPKTKIENTIEDGALLGFIIPQTSAIDISTKPLCSHPEIP